METPGHSNRFPAYALVKPAFRIIKRSVFNSPLSALFWAWLLISCWLGAGSLALSQSLVISPGSQFEFAEVCFREGDYFRAVTEFKRFLHFFPDHEQASVARYRIGSALFHHQQFDQAIDAFKALMPETFEHPLSALQEDAYFMISECFAMQKAYSTAIQILQHLSAIATRDAIKDKARYRSGWLYIQSAAWDQASMAFSQLSPESQALYRIPALAEQLSTAEHIDRKSPAIAGAASALIPGMGYVYCGRYRDAMTAFLLNSALILTAAESFREGHEFLGGVISLIELGFYSGTIYGSANAALAYNRRQTRNFIESLQQKFKIVVSAADSEKAVKLVLTQPF